VNFNFIRLVIKLGHINPAIWDAIIPHGPPIAIASAAADLNPQPLPPAAKLQLASAEVAKEIAQAAIAAGAADNSEAAAAIVSRAIDDWCGNSPKLFPFPWPGKWPFPWPPDPEEEFKPDIGTSRVIGALTLASVAARMAEGEVREVLGKGAEQLLEAGLAG
jgi:hypothetical protein